MTDVPSQTLSGQSRLRRLAFTLLKGLVTAGLVLWLLRSIDLGQVGRRLADIDGAWLIVALLLPALQIVLLVLRWLLVVRLAVPDFGWREASHNLMTGLFFNQVLPSGMGGDAMRAWLLTRGRQAMWPAAITAILTDRVVGLIGLVLIAGAMAPGFLAGRAWGPEADARLVAGAIALLFAGVAAGYVFLAFVRRLPTWLRASALGASYDSLRRALVASGSAPPILALSIAAHITLLLSIAAAARAYGIAVPLAAVMVLTPPAMVLAMLPLSIAGWGLRETGFVAVLALAGVSATDAALLGLTVGLLQLAQGLAGGLFWILGRRRRAAGAAAP